MLERAVGNNHACRGMKHNLSDKAVGPHPARCAYHAPGKDNVLQT